ncbi:MAG: excinuclease ABC subunit UvrA [Oscillospiraceae bacterium]|nr:excinuclease ABC subunit UvrA [Oscillospiraceae bacterium]
MAVKDIYVKGAREHNLKNIEVTIPRDKMVVFTGLSGSGKSSLAFDTIYAEGQRRYMESLSSYARQFLGLMEKPKVETIEGLSPAISIDQKTTSKNPRSTVGTVTEIYDYLRLLYARIGVPHCPICGREIKGQSIDQIVDRILDLPEGTKIQVMAPIARGKKGEYVKELEHIAKQGFVRARIDGEMHELSEKIKLEKNIKHTIEIIVDRLVIKDGIRTRLTDSVETASKLSKGQLVVDVIGGEQLEFSQTYACPEHDISITELAPRMFSFNNPFGACQSCGGLGEYTKIDPELLIPDKNLSIRDGAINCYGWSKAEGGTIAEMYFEGIAKEYGFSIDVPVKDMKKADLDKILYGTGDKRIKFERTTTYSSGTFFAKFEGVVNNLQRKYDETTSEASRRQIESLMSTHKCSACNGRRLRPESLAVTVGSLSIDEFTNLSIRKELEFIENLKLSERDAIIAELIIKEIKSRLNFLCSVGLDYLNLSRKAGTLSGGESQRIRLATQIGSSLMGVLYILDEPSIGLHQRDNDKLIETLKNLRDLGNTLIVVEHDEDTMRAADYIVDIGPGAGINGGEVVATGTAEEIMNCSDSITGQYLSGKRKIPVPSKRRKGNGKFLEVYGAEENNLKSVDVKVPLGTFTCVTGVSGSGKSSLVNEVIHKTLARDLNRAKAFPGKCKCIKGLENLDKCIDIDQSPIGRMPSSNPATYTNLFNDIRTLFASTQDAKIRGYNPGRVSLNVKGGRCEYCKGDGIVKIEMHFLADVYVPCDVCGGSRYNRETLEVKYKGKNIADVLAMSVDEAVEFFAAVPKIYNRLRTLQEVGLGYVTLGQSATTLSGGEAQRVKLATELSKRSTGKTFYILDEPTTGLHTADVHKLIEVLQKLVDAGNTVLVIEHNLDVIKTADYIIDLGPEGGDKGGTILCTGTPEIIAKCKKSYTGQYLKKIL